MAPGMRTALEKPDANVPVAYWGVQGLLQLVSPILVHHTATAVLWPAAGCGRRARGGE